MNIKKTNNNKKTSSFIINDESSLSKKFDELQRITKSMKPQIEKTNSKEFNDLRDDYESLVDHYKDYVENKKTL